MTYRVPNHIAQAGSVWDSYVGDQYMFTRMIEKAEQVQIPPSHTYVGYALKDAPTVFGQARDAIKLVESVLSDIAQNMRDTEDAYTTNENLGVEATKQIWKELDSLPSGRPGNPPPHPNPPKNYRFTAPSHVIHDAYCDYNTVDFMLNILRLGEEIKKTRKELLKAAFGVINGVELDELVSKLDAKLEPIKLIGTAFTELANGYERLWALSQDNRYVLFTGWEGDAADVAANYMEHIEHWLRNHVQSAFGAVGQRWVSTADDIHTLVSEAASVLPDVIGYIATLRGAWEREGRPADPKDYGEGIFWAMLGGFVAKSKFVKLVLTVIRIANDVRALINLISTAASPDVRLILPRP